MDHQAKEGSASKTHDEPTAKEGSTSATNSSLENAGPANNAQADAVVASANPLQHHPSNTMLT